VVKERCTWLELAEDLRRFGVRTCARAQPGGASGVIEDGIASACAAGGAPRQTRYAARLPLHANRALRRERRAARKGGLRGIGTGASA
jgi:hypothetical protein